MATITGPNSTAVPGTARTLVRRLTGIVVAVAAMMIGFAVAGSASQAHADTVTGSTYFTSTVECGGDTLVFTTNSDADYGSYAQVWVWDSYTQEWVTDGNWVEADYYASYNIADLTFDHLVPRSKGGESVWVNVVTACAPCNLRKGDRTLEQVGMILHTPPRPPQPVLFIKLAAPRIPERWTTYLNAAAA